MNLLIVTRRYPPFIGGAQHQTKRIADTLKDKGHNVTVITGKIKGTDLNDKSIVALSDPSIRFLGTLLFILQLMKWMFFKRKEYDAVFCTQLTEVSSIALYMSNKLGKPSIVWPGAYGPVWGDLVWLQKRIFATFHMNQIQFFLRT